MKIYFIIFSAFIGFLIGRGTVVKQPNRLHKAVTLLNTHIENLDNYCVNHTKFGLEPSSRFEFCSAANALAVFKLDLLTAFEHYSDVSVKHMYREAPITSSISIVESNKEQRKED